MDTTHVSDTWERGSPYEQYIGRWSRRIAPLFLQWLDPPAGKRWLDVGCGTGALSAAILDRCAPGSLVGVEPSDGFRELAVRKLAHRARFLAGDAAALPLDDGACDVVVSGLVLNFVPALPAALSEMKRVTAPGGEVAAYVWDYAEGMEVIRRFWDVAASLDHEAARLHEGIRFPVCRPTALEAAFVEAGFSGVETSSLDAKAEFADFEDYWRPFLGGQGPAPAYVASLPEDRRATLRTALESALRPASGGAISLRLRAWAVRGARRSALSAAPAGSPGPGASPP
ncbi:class I SAM-dependent methyltransferase [Zeimonas arvi]|uniref:Class I SAM-dependent methyltransferase n=1 Tax=Zeimonas arvi TaxID=2498847 RepID=A0A5C8P5D2_9BURK|nr:class I SAM-dependent methyltransferase [Zeimonas arvi]TXL68911.1 class I SAM-dependent methyltransferase [Zeimonas arvi]